MNAALKEALQSVWCEDLQASIVDGGMLKQCDVADHVATIRLVYGFAAKSQHAAMQQRVTAAALTVEGVREVQVVMDTEIVAHAAQHGVERLGQVRNVVAVASGKGGVGKS
ncbi:MAG: iron-sulfur cluster assembly protein, partial [Burkholderiaceae bacterium]|nr:iron-sulfur cluster assembly protein [Burkholderiaceae bacterium]